MTPHSIGILSVANMALEFCVHGFSHMAVLLSKLSVGVNFFPHEPKFDCFFVVAQMAFRIGAHGLSHVALYTKAGCKCTIYTA